MDKFLENNIVARAVAVLVAVMLWMIVSLENQASPNISQTTGSSTIDNVRLEVIYDEELYALKEVEDTVQVVLSGRRSLLNINTFRTNHRVYVELSNLGEGRHRVKVLHEGFPSELQVEIVPAWINVVLEKKEVRSFPVKVDLTGAPKEGFTAEMPVASEEEVHVIAPPSVLDQVEAVRGFININNADTLVKQEVVLKVYDQQGNELPAEVSPSSIQVEVPIQSPSKVVPWDLHLINQLPAGLSLVDVHSNVTEVKVFAPLEELESLEKVEQNLNLITIAQSGKVVLDIPVQKEWYTTYPKQAEVELVVGPTEERTFTNIPIQVKGVPEGFTAEFITPIGGVADVTIQGSKEKLEQLKVENISASIDVRRGRVGEQTLRLQIELAQDAAFYKVVRPIDVQLNLLEEKIEVSEEVDEEGQEESDINE